MLLHQKKEYFAKMNHLSWHHAFTRKILHDVISFQSQSNDTDKIFSKSIALKTVQFQTHLLIRVD